MDPNEKLFVIKVSHFRAFLNIFVFLVCVIRQNLYKIFACNGILFNHESPIRGETFVTRKITRAASKIALGLQDKLYLGNLDAKRDWGHAKDYVRAQWTMLQQDTPDDFVIATGRQISVRDFVKLAGIHAKMHIEFEGSGINEVGYNTYTGKVVVQIDPQYFRPAEVETLLGDPSKAKRLLGWEPEISLHEMCREMMKHDLNLCRQQALLKSHGY